MVRDPGTPLNRNRRCGSNRRLTVPTPNVARPRRGSLAALKAAPQQVDAVPSDRSSPSGALDRHDRIGPRYRRGSGRPSTAASSRSETGLLPVRRRARLDGCPWRRSSPPPQRQPTLTARISRSAAAPPARASTAARAEAEAGYTEPTGESASVPAPGADLRSPLRRPPHGRSPIDARRRARLSRSAAALR